MIIPRTMSTQHPDNANPATFAEIDGVLKGDGEIREAYHAFNTLECDEQMWDYEGKAADSDVVHKLLIRYPDYFDQKILGQQKFLTLRLPNPNAEHGMRKKVEEALQTIVTSYDIAARFYNTDTPPIFEVILPFTTSAEELVAIDSSFIDGTQIIYRSGIITDTALKPGDSGKYVVNVKTPVDSNVQYITRDIHTTIYE